ncbi:hypothetical protein QVD17_08407 [Tagetes erecta]|uniref:Uncharacterized protein n=1 Tax=Tagetes erecta TaxID=13708 RepID=A0AAD8KZG3_TARER|nr:hypothetical protein QVD17_08407 [Tagetes erecta]
MDSTSASEYDQENKSQRGPTMNSKATKGKTIITYNKRGVPIGDEATKLSTFEGLVARTMVPISYVTWKDVGEDTEEDSWRYVL